MNARDFRLGNLTEYMDDTVSLDMDDLYQLCIYMKAFNPIVLFDKWMILFNAEAYGDNCFTLYTDNYPIDLTWKGDGYDVDVAGIVIARVKYVHELQNLYFALTKKELEI